MLTRRDIMQSAAVIGTLLLTKSKVAIASEPGDVMPTKGEQGKNVPENNQQGKHYRPRYRL